MFSADIKWHRQSLDTEALAALDAIFATRGKPGARLPLDDALRAALAPIDQLIAQDAPGMAPVRVLAFDKSDATNWSLPWHQDRVIAVASRADLQEFHNWSRKQGIWHCEPPTNFLTDMLFVRVHLDDADESAGAMEIAMGSHAAGLVPADRAETVAGDYPAHLCTARRGDVLILPMLTLHRSRAAERPATRRVLRVDYAASSLPPPLVWAN